MPNLATAQILPFPELEGPYSFKAWKARITAAEERRDSHRPDWKANIARAYRGKLLNAMPDHDYIVVPKDYANVEQKKPQLFFQNPEVQLTALQPGLEPAALLFQAVINHHLGPYGVDAKQVHDEVLVDILCPAGIGVTKIGYENVVDGAIPLPPDATNAVPAPGGVEQPPPEPQLIPNIIYENYYWGRISPTMVLIPDDFHGSNYDDAAWLGYKDYVARDEAQRTYGIAEVLLPAGGEGPSEEESLSGETYSPPTRTEHLLTRYTIYYKASVFDPSVRNPEEIRELIILNGLEAPARNWQNPTLQRYDDRKRIIGMKGFPVHLYTLRYVSDSAYPPSDCTVSKPQVEELAKSRTQMILQRDRSIPMRFIAQQRAGGPEGVAKIIRNIYQAFIPVPALDKNNPITQEVARAQYPRENFEFNAIINRDIDEAWALSSTQRGQETDDIRSATEINRIATASETRMEAERNRMMAQYVRGVEKLASLLQLNADQESYVRIVGPTGASQLAAWDKSQIAGRYAFSIKPDSSIRLDVEKDRRQLLQLYNFFAQDPNIVRNELSAPILRKFNFDPQRLLSQPPPKGPDPPNISYRFSGEDLNPVNPAFPLIMEILRQGGVQISQEAIAAAQQHAAKQSQVMTDAAASAIDTGIGAPALQTEHMGAAERTKMLSKHQGSETGAMTGPKAE